MIENFWEKLPKPFFCLAPMADVTDAAFRQIIAKYSRHENSNGYKAWQNLHDKNTEGLALRSFSEVGGPDVFWTEFVSADGLAHPVAREKLLIDLSYTKDEQPIVAQLFGSNPANMEEASRLCVELGFDGIDINMGCPDKTIEKQGAGAAMMKDQKKAKEILDAARRGAGNIPVSIKTRIGFNKDETETWIRFLLEQKLPTLTVHLRTRKEMSDVPAHWELMPKIVALRDTISPETLIIGNGDVLDIADAKKKAKETGCDGIMFGRAIFGNPWLFDNPPAGGKKEILVPEKLRVMVAHTKLFEKLLGGVKSFAIMKKHYKAYVNGFNGAKELRMKLMDEAKDAGSVERIVNEYLLTKE